MEKLEEDIEYSDYDEDYQGKNNPADAIVVNLINSIASLLKNELYGGFYEERPIKIGDGVQIIRKYIPDTREAFCQLIDWLMFHIYPYSENEGFKKEVDNLFEKEEKERVPINERVKARRKIYKTICIVLEDEGLLREKMGIIQRAG